MITIAKKVDVKKGHDSVQPNDTGTIRSPHPHSLSLSHGEEGGQTINSSALKSFSPVIILITILILVMDKTFEMENEMLPKTCVVALDHF